MSSVAEKLGNKYVIYNTTSKRYVGPEFDSEELCQDFISWYDGDVGYIGSWIDKRTWDEAIEQWKNTKDNKIVTFNYDTFLADVDLQTHVKEGKTVDGKKKRSNPVRQNTTRSGKGVSPGKRKAIVVIEDNRDFVKRNKPQKRVGKSSLFETTSMFSPKKRRENCSYRSNYKTSPGHVSPHSEKSLLRMSSGELLLRSLHVADDVESVNDSETSQVFDSPSKIAFK